MISIYGNKVDNNLTIRDKEALQKYVNLIQWGRAHPVQFIEQIMQVPLMDYQKWIISESWTVEYAVWVCSRNAGKSFLLGVYMQARALLYPKSIIQILSTSSRQANETFDTMEKIAKHQVKTLISDNSVFVDEIKVEKSDTDGFTHDKKTGSMVRLLNGSEIKAVTGTAKTVRGKRSNINVYDEAGTISRDFYDVTEPFCTQSSDFKTGANYDSEVYPKEVPNTRLYVGSATDTNSLFWEKYREAFKQMLIGNKKYFVADLDCEIPLHPTQDGKPHSPLLSQDEIDRKTRENEITANREYHNIFDRFDQEDAMISRADIAANIETYLPHIKWAGKKHKYVITYDPAAKVDNAPVLITEIFKDDETHEIKGRFVHMENLVHTFNDGSKRPMRLDEQVDRLRQIIYEYNGKDNVPAYDNIMVLIDAGTGGQCPAIAQELCKDWTDANGKVHPGLYDETSEDMRRWVEKFPKAISGHMKLMEPTKYRTAFFDAARVLIPSGVMKFPPNCPKGNSLVNDDGSDLHLDRRHIASLLQMDFMKEELASMVRVRTPRGQVTYGLPPEKKKKCHDDRCYVAVMACWWIQQLRTDDTLGEETGLDYGGFIQKNKEKSGEPGLGSLAAGEQSDDSWLKNFSGTGVTSHSRKKGANPFSGGKNPFGKSPF